MKNLGTYWVDDNCMFAHANGVDLRYESDWGMDYDPDDNPSPEPEPWSLLKLNQSPAMGMGWEDHNEECHVFLTEGADRDECDCETRDFSTSSCDGCGNYIHGTRHAMTVFQD